VAAEVERRVLPGGRIAPAVHMCDAWPGSDGSRVCLSQQWPSLLPHAFASPQKTHALHAVRPSAVAAVAWASHDAQQAAASATTFLSPHTTATPSYSEWYRAWHCAYRKAPTTQAARRTRSGTVRGTAAGAATASLPLRRNGSTGGGSTRTVASGPVWVVTAADAAAVAAAALASAALASAALASAAAGAASAEGCDCSRATLDSVPRTAAGPARLRAPISARCCAFIGRPVDIGAVAESAMTTTASTTRPKIVTARPDGLRAMVAAPDRRGILQSSRRRQHWNLPKRILPTSPHDTGTGLARTGTNTGQKEFYNKTPSHDTRHGTGAHWH